MGRFGNLADRRLRTGVAAATPRQAQRVLVKGAVEIAGAILESQRYRAMYARYRDLQQQGDGRENLTETVQITRPPGRSIAISPLTAHNLIFSASSWVSRSFRRS